MAPRWDTRGIESDVIGLQILRVSLEADRKALLSSGQDTSSRGRGVPQGPAGASMSKGSSQTVQWYVPSRSRAQDPLPNLARTDQLDRVFAMYIILNTICDAFESASHFPARGSHAVVIVALLRGRDHAARLIDRSVGS